MRSNSILNIERNIILSLKYLPFQEQKEVSDFIEFLRQKKIKQVSNIKKILSLEGVWKNDIEIETRIKNIRKELNKWRIIESV